MKRILIFIFLFLFFIAATPLLIKEPGYISIAMAGMVYELTVYTAIFWILITFICISLVFVFIRGGLRFSLGGWNKIAFAGQRRGISNFNRGIAAYILEDYQQAEHLLAKSAEPAKCEATAYLLAASAGEKQSLPENTTHYLNLLNNYLNNDGKPLKNNGIESVLVTIKLLIGQKNYQQARTLIDEHHKHIGHDARLLSLEIDLCLIEKRFQAAVEHLNAARKEKDITPARINQWQKIAFQGVFSEKITTENSEALEQYWQNLARKLKQQESIILAYCQVLAEHNITEPLNKLLLPALKKGTDKAFLQAIRTLPINSAETLISAVQKHLHSDQHNAMWLSCLAHLAAASKQWSMAEKAFNSLVNLQGKYTEQPYDNVDLQTFAEVLNHQEQHQKANQVLFKIVKSKGVGD